MLPKRLRSLISTIALSLPLLASAGPFTHMYVFGDSLSDTGNLFIATGGAQPPAGQPYFNGRFSNGLLWVEDMAVALGLTPDAAPYLVGGNNYAFAGARTGAVGSPPGVLAQAAGIWASTHAVADPNALYVVVGGGNDMRDARSAPGENSATLLAAATAAVANIGNTVAYLASRGAKNILISTLPDLGFTPEAILLGLQAASSEASADFNTALAGLVGLEALFPGLDLDLLDMAAVSAAARTNPAAFGFTNTSSACNGFVQFINPVTHLPVLGTADCATSLFSDDLHPSAAAHLLIARAALTALEIPEPDSLALFGLAVAALAVARRRYTASSKTAGGRQRAGQSVGQPFAAGV